MSHTHHASKLLLRTAHAYRWQLLVGILIILIMLSSWGPHSPLHRTDAPISVEKATDLALAQLPALATFHHQDALPKTRILSQPTGENKLLLGFAELGLNDDVTISLACVQVADEKATLIKKVVPGLSKDVKVQNLTVAQIDLATCMPKDTALGAIPPAP